MKYLPITQLTLCLKINWNFETQL